ncbi:hypothetical protein D3C75_1215310 [compost metagenome]
MQDEIGRHLGINSTAFSPRLVGQYIIQSGILGEDFKMDLMLALLAPDKGTRRFY